MLTVLVLRVAWTSAGHALTVTVLVASAGHVVGTVLCRYAGETTIPHIPCGALSCRTIGALTAHAEKRESEKS
ncbi:hypothetical protein [Actinopolyspora halophila]|uniref:hypothetical protein n=1 Tax=Actinopolyspora halophila TaxID=1850 RepID=UPI0012FCB009|nr:hypothetical protein [Actinopolyspora halophila]